MLSNEVPLLFQLLDSLSNSLRDLAIKYELLVSTTTRQSSSIEKSDAVISEMANEVSSSFDRISKDFELLKIFAAESKYKDSSFDASINEISKLLASMHNAIIAIENLSHESKSVSIHVDSHMDAFGNQLASLQVFYQSFAQELVKMTSELQSMKAQLEPLKKLAVLFSKPVSILLGISFIVVSILAFMKIMDEYKSFVDKNISSITESARMHSSQSSRETSHETSNK
jgi:chromosome segregation ATPase